jgi:hypothetical protein
MGNATAQIGNNVDTAMLVASTSQCRTSWKLGEGTSGLALGIKSSPSHGSVTIEGTALVYKPSPGFKGADSFVISIEWTSRTGHKRGTATYHVTVQ